jgi:hypothetical protein
MKRFLLFAASMTFVCFGQAANKGGKLGVSPDSGHGTTGTGGGTSSVSSTRMPADPRTPPPLVEKRTVHEQDCTKPVDPQGGGNLKCK